MQVAAEVIGARYAAIGVIAAGGNSLSSFTTHGIEPALRDRIGAPPSGLGILGLVIREAKPIRLADLSTHPASRGFPPHHPPMHSFLGVPIVGRRGVLGNLYVTEKAGGAEFSEEDEDIAILLAAKTAAAIENARHHEESARLLEEVQQLQRSRERFFAMVNHELRNALAAVYGWSEMLVRKRDPATIPHAALEVLDSAQHAIRLIDDLLDLSRLDEDRLKPILRAVEPISMATRAMHRATPAADRERHRHGVGVESRAAELRYRRASGRSDSGEPARQRHQVCSRGECRESDHHGTKNRILYTVEDEGPGVAERDVERIFDIYVTKADEESRGIGLGLPLSRRLARLLGGELTAVSTSGKGGRFVLELPSDES